MVHYLCPIHIGKGMYVMDEFDKADIGTGMIIGGFVGLIVAGVFTSYTLLTIAGLSMVVGCILIFIGNKNNKDAYVANIHAFEREYDEYTREKGIVKSDIQVTLISLDEDLDEDCDIPCYLWINNGVLNIFPKAERYIQDYTSITSKPDISQLKQISIPIDTILYFEEVGELRRYATVSGGGTSLKGALLGYVIADDIGAIIGSRKPITTNVVSEDDRRIELIYKNSQDEVVNLEFKHNAYKVFKKLIPLKEFKRIVELNTIQDINDDINVNTQKSQAVKEKLKQLNDLKSEGLITEEEFLEQKKKILDSF